MTEHPASFSTPGPAPRRRLAPLLGGLALVLVAVAATGAGAYAAVAAAGGTYLDLGGHGTYRTDRYALATDATNWRTELLGWAGTVRVEVAPAGDGPIFVGAAAPDAIGDYLSGTGYTTVAEHTGRGVVRTDHDGAAPALPPARAGDWTAHAAGVGTQTLRWKASAGRQVVLAMNADGSRPVQVRVVSSGVTLDRMPWWVPAALLALGAVLVPVAVVVLRRARRVVT